MDSNKTTPLTENGYVKELLELMESNNITGRKDLLAVIGQVANMEKHLSTMVNELAAMRKELAEAQLANKPIKAVLQKAVNAMQTQIAELRDKLAELKQEIIDGCKNALSACKDKGLSALRNVTEFFKIKPALESLRNSLDKNINLDNRMISKIEAMSTEFHEAGRHVHNIGRAFTGKETIQEAKPVGKIAKTIEAPIKADLECQLAMRRCVNIAIKGLTRLENMERKPPIMETVNKLNEQIERSQRDTTTIERPKPTRAER